MCFFLFFPYNKMYPHLEDLYNSVTNIFQMTGAPCINHTGIEDSPCMRGLLELIKYKEHNDVV